MGGYGAVEIVVDDQSKRTTPSVVAFEDSKIFIGEEAKKKQGRNTIHAVKRIIGRTYNDPAVAEHQMDYQYEIVDDGGKAACCVEYCGSRTIFSPEYISCLILWKMKEIVEKSRGETVTSAVITVPAYFSDSQRAATRKAGEDAGLFVSAIINEPTAAAIAYGMQQFRAGETNEKKILVYDLGGGTFDVTVLAMEGRNFNLIAHGGDTRLGGEDFDVRLEQLVLQRFLTEHGDPGVQFSTKSLIRLRQECEMAKTLLSGQSTADVEIEVSNFHQGVDLVCDVTRSDFESACEDIFQKTVTIVTNTLADANLSKTEVDEILLVGGSAQIPRVREIVREYFSERSVHANINRSEAIAVGATIVAADRAYTIVAEVEGEASARAMGPARIGMQEVTAHSLGVDHGKNSAFMSVIVPKGTKLPASGRREFCNKNSTNKLPFTIYQGEDHFVAGNTFLDKFVVKAKRQMKPTKFHIVVDFHISEDGILRVTATSAQAFTENIVREIEREIW